jgi:hypothetical protein
MKAAKAIRQRIENTPLGEPFTSATFLEWSTRASVDQTLSRLAKAGRIVRVARGVYVRPKESRYIGKVMPEPFKIAEAIAKATGATVQVHGAEAAHRLELSTQVPTQSVFYTSGPSRCFRVGNLEIRLRHTSPRKLALAGQPAGLALAALWYLGKGGLTESVIESIRKKLSSSEFEVLKSAAPSMPAWMADALIRHERRALRA